MIHLINFADEKMTRSQKLCSQSAFKNGVDKVTEYSWINNIYKTEFYYDNYKIFEQERGRGFWLWKPFIIYREMRTKTDGDILIYCDAGIKIIGHVQNVVSGMDEDIFFFTNTFKHVEWAKGDMLDLIIPEWRDGIYNDNMQVQASVIFFKINQTTKDFVKEWLLFSQMPGIIDDSPSRSLNAPTFAENRHDQAVLCCLQIKHKYKLHWFPTTTAHHIRHKTPDDTYEELFLHHRKRNDEWSGLAI